MGKRSISNPDQDVSDRRRERRVKVEQRIMEVEFWLISFPSTHPEWTKYVREYNALNIQLAQLDGEKPVSGFELSPYRILNN